MPVQIRNDHHRALIPIFPSAGPLFPAGASGAGVVVEAMVGPALAEGGRPRLPSDMRRIGALGNCRAASAMARQAEAG
jgi:hypothetical protein